MGQMASRERQKFSQGENGSVLLEALLVMPILLIVFAALIEFGFAVFQWSQAVKALQLGARLNRLIYGSDGVCDSNFGTSLPGMCDFNRQISPSSIRVSYARGGLGYVGRPAGPVVTTTVELDGLHFSLPFLGALLGINGMDIPAHPVTVTSEDLWSSAAC